ncbi:ATP-grasp domain-containing protein [Psychrobacter faecalis]|uniref:ATP-grasp domain-containing protein n=1 Tax=Psychrobacter faecalis TaxID=180588 RepID=UPI0019197797|nr:ATP-grasp domain-containing protein [Psychrobacter faecalis]
MKKILILGGSEFQTPLITAAKKKGLYVITCDYLPENPGHQLSDLYVNASTTDKEAVLQVAIENKIDAITTFSSDPAIPTIAYVAETLGLPGISSAAAESLSNKDAFRQLLHDTKLNTPDYFVVEQVTLPEGLDKNKRYIVKPVDSSGSKGVRLSDGTVDNTIECITYALSFSRSGKCIIEEYIDGPQIHGDAFLQDGNLIDFYFGDHYFYTATNSFIPISTRWPATNAESFSSNIKQQIEALAAHIGYLNGPLNIEARLDNRGNVYIIEAGARNGGNFVPIIQKKLTGFDYVTAVLRISLGETYNPIHLPNKGVGAYYIIHAEKSGTFNKVNIDSSIEPYLFKQTIFKKPGDLVEEYRGSHTTIGVLLFQFPSVKLRDNFMNNIRDLVKVLYER